MNAQTSVSTETSKQPIKHRAERRKIASAAPLTWAAAAAVCLSLLATPAGGQTIYHCGSAYSQQPCEGGRAFSPQDERTTAQRAQAQTAVRRESAAADAMEKARLRDEAKTDTAERRAPRVSPYSAVTSEPMDMAPARYDGDPRLPRPDVFVARVPGKPGEKVKVSSRAHKPAGANKGAGQKPAVAPARKASPGQAAAPKSSVSKAPGN